MNHQELNNIVDAKLEDMDIPGAVVEMDPEEAELAGAFHENAITLYSALEGAVDEHNHTIVR